MEWMLKFTFGLAICGVFLALPCFGVEGNNRPDYVAIDSTDPSCTVFFALKSSQIKTSLEDFKIKIKMNVVTLEELKEKSGIFMKSRVLRNDYPNQDAIGGLLKLIQAGFATEGLGLTWNGGIALTFNDFQFARKSYEKFRKDKFWKGPNPRMDPVNPAHHLKLLDPNYLKTLHMLDMFLQRFEKHFISFNLCFIKFTTMTINDFAKLDFLKKMILIECQATLIDTYPDNSSIIKAYALNDFFVEVNVNTKSRFITDIIPYKRGFQFSNSVRHSMSA